MTPLQIKFAILGLIVSACAGGLGGAIFSHYFAPIRDAAARKRTFRGYIRSVQAECRALKTIRDGGLVNKHSSTISDVRRACCDVKDIVSTGFQDCWVRYCGLTEKEIEPKDESYPPTEIRSLIPQYERGRELIVALLAEMIRHAE